MTGPRTWAIPDADGATCVTDRHGQTWDAVDSGWWAMRVPVGSVKHPWPQLVAAFGPLREATSDTPSGLVSA